MEYLKFMEQMHMELEQLLPADCNLELNHINKNNGSVLEAFCMMQNGSNIAPTFYLKDYYGEYQKGRDVKSLAKEMYSQFLLKKPSENIDMEFFLDFGQMKKRIVYKLVNYQLNRELLEKLPHCRFLDLAIVFYCIIKNDMFANASILIYHKHLEKWGKSTEEIYQAALINTPFLLPFELRSMEEVMREALMQDLKKESKQEEPNDILIKAADQMLQEEKDGSFHIPMYILGNQEKFLGAAAILYDGLLADIAEKLGGDFFILPSSVHEVILLPFREAPKPECLPMIVQDVNKSQLEEDEVLSDHVYYYSKDEDAIKNYKYD